MLGKSEKCDSIKLQDYPKSRSRFYISFGVLGVIRRVLIPNVLMKWDTDWPDYWPEEYSDRFILKFDR
jgi:hypothetical protein